ncbi:hypothetical protein Taro_021343 [Colocasia esculenta]|uniref:Uncharacterized protein n=1 Tax=Colocasia esculenta TaxID=4460 RepID=A0A843VB77_COLES|nr:hypothetical protein [Colocasia esculenta]
MWRSSWGLRSCGTTTRSSSSSPSHLLRPAQTVHLRSTKGTLITLTLNCNGSQPMESSRAPAERRSKHWADRNPKLNVPLNLKLCKSQKQYSPTAVSEFFNNLGMTDDQDLYTTFKGIPFQITPNLFSRALQIPNTRANILLTHLNGYEYYTLIT